ncbi:MAG: helix-turn-helix transcriptional regulator [Hyphomicrobiaceae bacterium]
MAKLDLSRFRQMTFADRDEAETFLSTITEGIADARFRGDPRDFYLRYSGISLGHCDLHRGDHSELVLNMTRADEYHFMLPQRHGLRFTREDGTALDGIARRTALLLTPHQPGQCDVRSGTTGVSLVLRTASLTEHIENMTDENSRPRHFVSDARSLDLADPVVTALTRNVLNVHFEMQKLSKVGLSRVAAADFDDLLLGFASAVVSGDVRTHLSSRQADPGKSVARQAREYIEAQASEPIRFTELARSLGVSLRALQIGFRRQFGCSPREFLMTCRLQMARERLLSADGQTRVSTVAYDCGFSDLAVFSQKYREAYGELPSETVRRR